MSEHPAFYLAKDHKINHTESVRTTALFLSYTIFLKVARNVLAIGQPHDSLTEASPLCRVTVDHLKLLEDLR